MDVVLIRHAQPEWARGGEGVTDPVLTDLGRRQAEQVAQVAASWQRVAEIWVSPTKRTLETAAPIARALGLTPRIVPDLREVVTPSREGKPPDHVAKIFAAQLERPPGEWWAGLPGGEDFRTFQTRVTSALQALLQEHGVRRRPGTSPQLNDVDRRGARLVLVGHGGTNAVALEYLLGLDGVPWPWERFNSNHASITRVRTTPLGGGYIFGLFRFNDVAHLARADRTR